MRDPVSKPRHKGAAKSAISRAVHFDTADQLASKSRPFLTICDLSEDELLAWASSYISRMGSGDVQSFVEWIHLRQRVREVT